MLSDKIAIASCEIQITIGCNNRCVYCYAGAIKRSREQEMPLSMFQHICQRLSSETNCKKLTLTGGEPTTHHNFKEIVSYARHALPNCHLHLQTNGRWFSKFKNAEFVAHAGIDSANISFQSYDAGIHDQLDGITGAHAQVVKGLYNLLDISNKHGRPKVSVNITLSKKNLPSYEKTLKYLYALGATGVSTNIMRINRAQGIMSDVGLNDMEAAEQFKKAEHISNASGKGHKNLHSFNLCQHDATRSGLSHYACAIGKSMMFIDNTGEVIPCSFIGSSQHPKIGNLNTNVTLNEIWYSDIFNDYRNHKYTHEKCRFCTRIDECGGVCVAVKNEVKEHELHPYISS